MANSANTDTIELSGPGPGFMVGVIAGGIVGAMLALAFAPRAGADVRRSLASKAKNLGAAASKRYEEASDGLRDAVGQRESKAHGRNEAAEGGMKA